MNATLWPRVVAPAPTMEPTDQESVGENNHGEDPVRLAALVELARDGDGDAFGALFDHYRPRVERMLLAKTRSTYLAEDMTSETFARALRGLPDFKLDAQHFGAWLGKIARNIALDHFKSRRAALELVTEGMERREAVHDGPDVAVLTILRHERLRRALEQLPANQRSCIALRFLDELSISETAELLGVTEGAVKQRQWRGLRSLSVLMRDEVSA